MSGAENISVANCYCDVARKLRGETITEPLERCFLFGIWADFLIEKGYGRKVSVQEALQIAEKCRDAGLIHNFADEEDPQFLCNCPKYCGSVASRKVKPSPDIFPDWERVHNYYAAVDPDLCTGCEACVDRCNFEAITMDKEGKIR